MCKRIVLEGICSYKESCAYHHKIGFHINNVNDDAIQEGVKNLKTEVDNLKNTKKIVFCFCFFDRKSPLAALAAMAAGRNLKKNA